MKRDQGLNDLRRQLKEFTMTTQVHVLEATHLECGESIGTLTVHIE